MEFKSYEDYAASKNLQVSDKFKTEDIKSELTDLLKKQFIRHYEQCGLLEEAATSIGVKTSQVLTWRNEDPAFKKLYDDTKDNFGVLLEDAAMKSALTGKQPILLMFLLKANNPEKYDENARNPNKGDSKITLEITDSRDLKPIDLSNAPKAIPSNFSDGVIIDAETETEES